ncbi:MAG: hypothetical protein IPP85_02475 [Propionivibrio sp.]|nr:hypothetical protein [Propionivibrio sp.]
MSPEERGDNFRSEDFEFPSFDEVTGTGYQLHPPPYTKEEQLALLENRVHGATLWEAMTLYCGAMRNQVGELFTINQDEYLQWARTMPIERFVSMNPFCSDGYSLVKKDKGWELQFRERGTLRQCQSFVSLDEAKEYLIRDFSPYGVFEQLPKSEAAPEVLLSENNSHNKKNAFFTWLFRK